MNRHLALASLCGALLLSGPALATNATFFENDNFGGRRFVASQSVADFSSFGFNDLASSVSIRDGAWQLCTDAFFRGRCVTLERGEYPSLGAMGLNDRISSAREVGWAGGGGGGGGGGGPVGVTLFDGPGFGGMAFEVDRGYSNLDRSFNDRAQSMIVHSGTWELCADADFRGECRTYGPGRYANLGPLAYRLSSLRPAHGGGGGGGGNWGGGGGNWGSGNRAVLYEGSNLTGRSFVVGDYMPNLSGTGFNDRGASLRVERGYWLFCSDADFRGDCRTFGPGDYPVLPYGLSFRISSGRRISNDYPYNRNPNWGN
jgi:hypothetical protein